ncbi:hypothetical protein BJX96DRAFT_149657 [Aspergillus floccosus]
MQTFIFLRFIMSVLSSCIDLDLLMSAAQSEYPPSNVSFVCLSMSPFLEHFFP